MGNACGWKPNVVTLHDGSQVMSDSEEWRHECEALTVINMPNIADRRRYLQDRLDDKGVLRDGVLQRRGPEALARLEATIKKIWYAPK